LLQQKHNTRENVVDNSYKNALVLGIETSCDETSVALFQQQNTENPCDNILSVATFSQIELHRAFGGVVPEVASRSQLEKINPVLHEALRSAGKTLEDVAVIAVTCKPGLPGSLLVGVCFAKALAAVTQAHLVGVNHLEGHIFSSMIEHNVPFPHVCIAASGGHTSMYIVHDFGEYELIGHTEDDAAGEAFDKIAKLLNLPYPGGPVIEQCAREAKFHDFFHYPRGKSKNLNFSFSGLKTAVMYDLVDRGAYDLAHKTFLKDNDLQFKQQVASSLVVCITDIFEQHLKAAHALYPHIKAITFVGGVACNHYLRERLRSYCTNNGLHFFTPSPQFCTDNAAMIALVGYHAAVRGDFDDLSLDIL
jgi:N6-L-threonylcarbamoyladenine synthase